MLNVYPGEAGVSGRPAFTRRLHGELRATYLFGPEPLARLGFAPMAFFGAGAAEIDGHATVLVSQSKIRGQQPVEVWVLGGPFFANLGGGMRYALSLRAGLTLAWKLTGAFGYGRALLTTGPEVGFQYGF